MVFLNSILRNRPPTSEALLKCLSGQIQPQGFVREQLLLPELIKSSYPDASDPLRRVLKPEISGKVSPIESNKSSSDTEGAQSENSVDKVSLSKKM